MFEGFFEKLTDDELSAKIDEIREKITAMTFGGEVAVVAAEGRRLEFTRANAKQAHMLLEEAISEQNARNGATVGRAIGVDFIR